MRVLRWSSRFTAALACAVVATSFVAGAGGAAVSKGTPTWSKFNVTPSSLPSKGGTVTVSATYKNTEDCKLSAKPSFKSSSLGTFACSSGSFSRKVTVPADKTGNAVDYAFTLTLVGASGDGSVTVPSKSIGVGAAPPPLTLSASPSSFGDEGVGITSAPMAVSVNNNSSASQDITGLSIGGTDAGDFATNSGSNCSGQLTPGQQCTVNVVFTPAGGGSRSGTLLVQDSSWGASGGTASFSLTGTGVFPQVSFTTGTSQESSLDFTSAQAVDTDSAAEQVTIADEPGTGDVEVPLKIGDIYTESNDASNFSIYADNCSGSLITPGSSCTFSVRFDPGEEGSRSTDIVVPDNTEGSESVLPVSGTGAYNQQVEIFIGATNSGTPTSTDTSTGSFDFYPTFGTVSTTCWETNACPTETFTISNPSSSLELAVGIPQMNGPNGGDFLMDANGCTGTNDSPEVDLAPGAYCTFGVTFQPAATGPRQATVDIPVDDSNGFMAVDVSGNDG